LKLNVVVAEAALELVPTELQRTTVVRNDSLRRGVNPSRMLLDRSFHHVAMLKLKDDFKRGRPDIVHATLLSLTSTPLYLDGFVTVYVHTHGDIVLEIKEGTRLPKSYLRFRGLMEKVLSEGGGEGLITMRKATIRELLKDIQPDWVCGLSTQGVSMSLEELSGKVIARKNPCIMIGGFPHGHFSSETLKQVDELVRIHSRPLEAHVVAARLLYVIEKRIEEKRTND